MYMSSSSFSYFCISLYCDACLKSSALRVGVKTLHNTTHVHMLHVISGKTRTVIIFSALSGTQAVEKTSQPAIHVV